MSRPPVLRNAIRAAITTGPVIGMSHIDLMPVVGASTKMLSATLKQMTYEGLLFGVGVSRRRRYFVSREALESAMPEVLLHFAALDELRKEVHRAYRREKARRQRARARAAAPPKPPKPAKEPNPRHKQRALVITKPKAITPAQAWARAEPFIPPNVKVTHCPGYQADRWKVQPPADGFAAMGVGRYLEAA